MLQTERSTPPPPPPPPTSSSSSSSSSSRLVSVSLCSAHTRAVVFHTLQRCQRVTRLCPYLINCATFYLLPFPQVRESSILTLLL